MVMAALFAAAFTAAGVLVAEVASPKSEDVLVLTTPLDCGDFVPEGFVVESVTNTTDQQLAAYFDYLTYTTKNGQKYASLVYNSSWFNFESQFI